jgi:hypothetical protein
MIFWSAPAERSGDGAFGRAGIVRATEFVERSKSGVALRLPPHSKMAGEFACAPNANRKS